MNKKRVHFAQLDKEDLIKAKEILTNPEWFKGVNVFIPRKNKSLLPRYRIEDISDPRLIDTLDKYGLLV